MRQKEQEVISYTSAIELFNHRGEPTIEWLDYLIEEGELPRYYQSFRRIFLVLGRKPSIEEIAWEQTQLNPESPVSAENVLQWQRCHESLIASFSPMIERKAEFHRTDLKASLEEHLHNKLERSFLMFSYASCPGDFIRYAS